MSNAASLSLPTSPLLAGLPESDLETLRQMLRPLSVAKGDAVYRAGEQLNTLYIVQSGQISVIMKCQTGQSEDTLVRTAGPGDLLGELPSMATRSAQPLPRKPRRTARCWSSVGIPSRITCRDRSTPCCA